MGVFLLVAKLLALTTLLLLEAATVKEIIELKFASHTASIIAPASVGLTRELVGKALAG